MVHGLKDDLCDRTRTQLLLNSNPYPAYGRVGEIGESPLSKACYPEFGPYLSHRRSYPPVSPIPRSAWVSTVADLAFNGPEAVQIFRAQSK